MAIERWRELTVDDTSPSLHSETCTLVMIALQDNRCLQGIANIQALSKRRPTFGLLHCVLRRAASSDTTRVGITGPLIDSVSESRGSVLH